MNKSQPNYDVVVVGGGMVGAAAALGLAQIGWSVALLEHDAPAPFDKDSVPDLRVSALGCTSVALLKQLGAWPQVQQMRYAPYRRLETWEQPGSQVVFDAASLSLPELGFMVENRILQLALWQQFAECPNLTLLCPSRLQSMVRIDDYWKVTLNEQEEIQGRLVIGADGANSLVRRLAGIGTSGWQYRQSCMLITVDTDVMQQDTTWQQFFPTGPRAFLPLFDHWASLVWYDSPQRIRQLQAMSMAQLSQEIAAFFPSRLGAVKAIAAGAFPLVRRHAQQYVKPGLVLLGDAAHTINPLAGQGVNLGYRDVDALLEVLSQARELAEPWHSEQVLLRYQRRRRTDNLMMQSGMDLFYTAFSNDLPAVKFARNLALMVAQRAGKLKEHALRYALGL
ncbi:ubiquinone biosynthesis hydroxylase, UbiH/UbiF/VisC/COQ6 family protein [Yersinia pseudotuberculosis IP 32953]|uniref:2-octaprenyl-3-methyl-6-methoxy-1,4-benzoquinol hydroxylase n=3 Tax=Yersinia pseudotuberculosis TaxID=633 RepID=A0ABN5RC48_YERPU|nr:MULTISPECIES: 3-demethoxyubiquinol 3-hydroxylase [Yersinia pseudotuberculosis complex]CQD50644.1 2-octaprenyl-3-methyl-6-methoxy-1%2C4-benzoquino l hydroxylase [Yersinia intermedia]ABS45899.1 2-octaprenyl-3-methyl-6-methoxy-1,4-benzoquinol hydroxylase [Yersinia pseudotuberculosis IP 31758]AJJ03081.1 ubiquinone biosynthesis hydroxylase, UbiH/UbiF/VisC/COQ6 family protein [Yersinia pseudotuberculosis]AJJ54088.1 ubiquinone biosynthesis hydroxylase, UbiH/UbiF/VisC/COQ6 family protein [Yersinia p